MSDRTRAGLTFVFAAACILPWIEPATALAAGILFNPSLGNPTPARTVLRSRVVLQASVVGLGFGLSLGTVLRVGARSRRWPPS